MIQAIVLLSLFNSFVFAGIQGKGSGAASATTLIGTVPIESGGTETTSHAANGVLVGSGTAAIGATAAMGNGGLVIGAGTSVFPATGTITGNASMTVTLGPGTIAIAVDPSSGTLMGSAFNGANQLLQANSSGLIPNADVDPSSVVKLNASGLVPNSMVDPSSVTKLGSAIDSGELPSDGYASTYVNVTGDTMTGALVVEDTDGGVAFRASTSTIAGTGLHMDAQGDIGIGVAAPATPLEIRFPTALDVKNSICLRVTDGTVDCGVSGANHIVISPKHNTDYPMIKTFSDSGGEIRFYNAGASAFSTIRANSTGMRWGDSANAPDTGVLLQVGGTSTKASTFTVMLDGNVGIGTTNPVGTFDVVGGNGAWSRTFAQLNGISPARVGLMYFCSNCTPAKIVVSTGTSAANFAAADGGAYQ